MSFLVRRRQRESMRVHGSVTTQAIALVFETVETGTLERAAPAIAQPRVRDSAQRLSEHPPLLADAAAQDEQASPPARESWRVRAASKAYESIAPEKAPQRSPRCSRRC